VRTESGNALWFILIAIGLLGLLTVSLTRSGSGTNETGSFEQNQIAASEILSTVKSIENAVQFLLTKGCSENEISFWHDSDDNGIEDASDDYYNAGAPSDKSCHVFDPAGAGMTYESGFLFTGFTRILSVGTDSRHELLIVLPNASNDSCNQVNRITGAPTNSGTPFVDNFDRTLFTGDFGTDTGNGFTIGDAEASLSGTETFCIADTSSNNYIVHVLHTR